MSGVGTGSLLINADDLGYSEATSAGILHAHLHGVVTSASLMVRPPAAADAVRRAAEAGFTDIGLHLDMGEWIFRDGAWAPLYEVVDLRDADAVAAECDRQIDRFCALVGRPPTHLDSHQHVHLAEPLRGIAVDRASALGVPLRHLDHRVTFCGSFYGQDGRGAGMPHLLSVEALLAAIDGWTATPGVGRTGILEIGCHPGWDDTLDTMYRDERRLEVDVLCDPALRRAIAERGLGLSRFVDVGAVAERGGDG